MRNNLIPTPRTDKNGRTVIRHVKADTGTAASATAIPPVASPAPKLSPQEQDQSFIHSVYGDDTGALPRRYKEAVRYMLDKNPGTLELIDGLLAKENPGGSQSVRQHIRDSLKLISDQLELNDDKHLVELSYTDSYSAGFKETLVRAWAIGSVRGDYSDGVSGYHDNDFQDGIAGTRLIIYGDYIETHPKRESDTDYWRGMMALYFTDPDYDLSDEEQAEIDPFIDFAGKHEDIGLVIRLAVERKTRNVSTLRGIIDQGSDAPAIRDGVL